LRRPLVLTGGPAVGKTTCGRGLAGARPASAFVDVDDLRQLVVSGAVAPWRGVEGAAQLDLGARNACALGRNLIAAGFDTVIADVVTPATCGTYRQELPGCLVVHLRIGLTAARQRAATRRIYLTDAEFEMLHRRDVDDPPTADLVLDVEGWTADEQVRQIDRIWSASA
jgi:predicted kinase